MSLTERKPYKLLIAAFALVYSLLLLYIVFAARRRHGVSTETFRSLINVIPFKANWHTYKTGFHGTSPYNFYTNLLGNIFLFIPLPVFIGLLSGISRWYLLILMGMFISIAIETAQYIMGIGVSDIDDVITNTIGACIGCIIFMLIRRRFHDHTNSM